MVMRSLPYDDSTVHKADIRNDESHERTYTFAESYKVETETNNTGEKYPALTQGLMRRACDLEN